MPPRLVRASLCCTPSPEDGLPSSVRTDAEGMLAWSPRWRAPAFEPLVGHLVELALRHLEGVDVVIHGTLSLGSPPAGGLVWKRNVPRSRCGGWLRFGFYTSAPALQPVSQAPGVAGVHFAA